MRGANENEKLAVYRSPVGWARATIALFWCTILLLTPSTLAGLGPHDWMGDPLETRTSLRFVELAEGAFPYIRFLLAAAFLVWLFRVRNNLGAFGIRGLRWGPRWTIFGWFVPVMCFFVPYQIVTDIWRGSQLDATAENWRTKPASPELSLWWACFIVGALAAPLLAPLGIAATLHALVNGITILGSVLALRLVSAITEQQSARYNSENGDAVLS